MAIEAIIFDVDGTLYPNYKMLLRSLPLASIHRRLYRGFQSVRRDLRREEFRGNIHKEQAKRLGEQLGLSQEKTEKKIRRVIYEQWEKVLRKVPPYPFLMESLGKLVAEGFLLGLLSDFPLGEKLTYLRLEGWWGALLCAEDVGSLKPARDPFLAAAEQLNVAPHKVLYVGNHYEYDIEGAKRVGMKAAHLTRKAPRNSVADFSFKDYRSFTREVLVHADRVPVARE